MHLVLHHNYGHSTIFGYQFSDWNCFWISSN